jgi:hypothetical protein
MGCGGGRIVFTFPGERKRPPINNKNTDDRVCGEDGNLWFIFNDNY